MRRNERGFALVELIVAATIMALLVPALSTGILLMVQDAQRGRNHITALRQVQNAGHWVSHDAAMARTVSTTDDPETPELEFITLAWTDWESGDVHEVIYTLDDMPDDLKKLLRRHVVHDVDGIELENTTTLIATNVTGASAFSQQDGVWRLLVEARSGRQTEARQYEVNLRVNT
ncbi:MAG: type II secretion system protein [Chloroflexota bacterium]